MDGTAANNSTAVPRGLDKGLGQSSVRKTAMPKLSGTAINKAMSDVARVP